MRVLAGSGERGPVVASAIIVSSLAVLVVTVLTGAPTLEVALLALFGTTAAVAYRSLLDWRALVAGLILVILFIPIRRYTVPGGLPFELEPYRLFVAFLLLGWGASLLVDPRIRLRRTGFEGPFALISAVALVSIVLNPSTVAIVETDVVKKLMFLASFFAVVYIVASVIRRYDAIDMLVKTLVAGGAAVAALAIVESRTGYNLFDHLSGLVPFLRLSEAPDVLGRGARLRVFGSAQHPIALGAAMVLIAPLAFYLTRRTGQRRWWLCLFALTIGCLATLSRTGIGMLMVVVIVFACLKPRETFRLWPCILPALVVIHFALPGALGSIKESFLPQGGLIADQKKGSGGTGSGRIADLGPALEEFRQEPFLGKGFGTRVVDPRPGGNAQILDNQWLGTLLETGAAGVFAWLWLFARAVRRFGAEARRDDSPRSWLLAAVAAGVAAFAVGMLTFDAFSFIQVTFLLFILIGLGAAALRPAVERERVVALRRLPPPAGSLEHA